MRRGKVIVVKTQQDIERACKLLDDRERDVLEDFADDIVDGEHEQRARWTQERSSHFDNTW